MVSSAANGIITSSKVQEAMTNTDRKHYCPHNPYQDSPQSIGKVAWRRRMVCWPMKNTLNCSCDMNKVGLLSWLEHVGYTVSGISLKVDENLHENWQDFHPSSSWYQRTVSPVAMI